MRVDAKHRQVISDVENGKRPTEDYSDNMSAYWDYLDRGKSTDDNVDYAASLFHGGGTRRAIMDAMLFGDAKPADIETVFDIPAGVIAAYRELFFDSAAFRTRIDKLAYMDELAEGTLEFELARRAYSIGPEFIYFTYGNHIPSTDNQRALVKKLYMTSAYKAMDSMFNSSTSKVSTAARDYAKLMLRAYETIEALLSADPDDGKDFVQVLLKKDLELSLNGESVMSPRRVSEEDII